MVENEASFALDRELTRTRVVSEPFRCVMRDDHPLARGPALDVDAYVAAAHVLVSTGGGDEGAVDAALTEVGRARRVAMTVPSFGGAVWFVAASDLVATLPAAAAARGAQRFNLAVRPVPLTLPRVTPTYGGTRASSTTRRINGGAASCSKPLPRITTTPRPRCRDSKKL